MKKVYLETHGCQMNVSDSERVATRLAADGYTLTSDAHSADVILINTCSVREKAEQKLFTQIGRFRQNMNKKPLIGVLGCVAQLEGDTLFQRAPSIDFVLGTRAVGRVTEAIESVVAKRSVTPPASGLRDRTFERTAPSAEIQPTPLHGKERSSKYLDLGERDIDYDWSVAEGQRHSKYVAFVPIIEGCNKFCTYCIVPFSRGRERSLSANEIVRQVKELRRQGVREVHLIGQNVNSYRPISEAGLEGFAGKTTFSRLLRAVAATGIDRIKFTTSFPRDFHPDIVDAIEEHENVCNWVHLPVQSGSDRILKAMRRLHSVDSYKRKIDRIRSSPRDIALTTDIIVGFPGETDKDFRRTVELVEYCGYDSAYIFKYSPRPGTPAFDMTDDLPHEVRSERFLELESVQKRVQAARLKRYIGRELDVLVEGGSARSASDLTGHSTCHKVVNFSGTRDIIGEIKKVRITEVKTNSLYGEVC